MSFIPNYYSVESVTSGHPDKLCDLIADSLLDAYLDQDPDSRVAIEVLGSRRMIHLAGEVTSRGTVDHDSIVRHVLHKAGYASDQFAIHSDVTQQSSEIASGVDRGGAGDQGIMYGYATDETPERLLKGLVFVRSLTGRLDALRTNGPLPWLKPDGKAQATFFHGHPTHIVVSAQHDESIPFDQVRESIAEQVIWPTMHELAKHQLITLKRLKFHINPAGPFTIGGFDSDTGLTGRKTQVDTYGGIVPHGGGAFSGKDATKVDRSAAYMARFAAKQLVDQGLVHECLVSVAYAIGEEEPVMLEAIDESGKSLGTELRQQFDFRPRAIIERLELKKPVYAAASRAGHFGIPNYPWEQ